MPVVAILGVEEGTVPTGADIAQSIRAKLTSFLEEETGTAALTVIAPELDLVQSMEIPASGRKPPNRETDHPLPWRD